MVKAHRPPIPYPAPTSTAATRVMRGNRKVDTKPEVRLRSELHRRGLRFRKNLAIHADGIRVRPDIVFPTQRLAVFVDGCFWHGCPDHGTRPRANQAYWAMKLARNQERDQRVSRVLAEAHWLVLRIWEHTSTPDAAALVIAAHAAAKGGRDAATS